MNVGVLFIFPDEKRIEFRPTKRLSKIKALYTDFNEILIKDQLRLFESKSKRIHNQLDKYIFGYKDLLSDFFITESESSLQFDDFRTGFYNCGSDEVINRYLNLLLGESNVLESSHSRITSDEIVRNLTHEIYSLNPSSKSYLKFDDRKILISSHIEFKFDFYWKNGQINHTKAVSLDLVRENSIIDQSLLLNAKLRKLEKTEFRHLNVDLVICKPRNLKFGDTFEEAMEILRDNGIAKRLYTDIYEYSKVVASGIKPQ